MADGVIAARTLFSGEALQSVMRVINLSDEPYNCRKDEQLGEATLAEVWTPDKSPSCDTASATVSAQGAGPAKTRAPPKTRALMKTRDRETRVLHKTRVLPKTRVLVRETRVLHQTLALPETRVKRGPGAIRRRARKW